MTTISCGRNHNSTTRYILPVKVISPSVINTRKPLIRLGLRVFFVVKRG